VNDDRGHYVQEGTDRSRRKNPSSQTTGAVVARAEAEEAQIDGLEEEVFNLRDQLAETETELAAVRQINRELTEELNLPRRRR